MKTQEGKDQKKESLIVNMFGRFQVIGQNGILNDDNIRSEMVAKLLAYILVHRTRMIPAQELGEVLWTEDETDNPIGALKNLMYRLRNTMKNTLGGTDYILTGRSFYYWNPDIEVYLDIEQFESLCNRIKQSDGQASRDDLLEWYDNALEMYQGSFLPKLSAEHWVVSRATYDHSLFLSTAKSAAQLYEREKLYDKMAEICSKAIELDNLDEEIHYLFIKALIGQNKTTLALDQYSKATSLLYENLGVRPSKQLQSVYRELMEAKHEQETDLGVIQQELSEDSKPQGVFMCEYGVFQEIYRLEVRRATRLGIAEYVLLLTIVPKSNISREGEAYLKIIKRAMGHMQVVLKDALRIGDVVSRYSGSQYVVLLPTCTYESAEMVTNRILTRFYSMDKVDRVVNVQYSLEEIALSNVIA